MCMKRNIVAKFENITARIQKIVISRINKSAKI